MRRFLIGVVMGTIAITLIYSPWGKQSGAHILSSGKSQTSGCYFLYSVSKFGRIVWGLFGDIIVGSGVHQSAVNYIVTVPILLAQIFAKLTFLGRIHPVSTGVEPS
ncbi:hypothetical protein [Nostoc sp. 'Lobaria pulmonaria (5183) cyanobiont']|uniref:hypothetical protein n=1 Tax=Nostoc sp. 'Lobaria pulmonaria (5183) cyanobiont' TaxID=1618022 RepID=UPI001F247E76|nr:hypothetical protein [Nostoc sp. 'Lobaria pulmonaria (5183) cyanobiont']